MTKILICDDHTEELALLKEILLSFYDTGQCDIYSFTKPTEAARFVAAGNDVDIAFLDIMMPGMNGIDLALKMRAGGFHGFLIFLTGVNDFAAQSYQVKAYSYILKPVQAEMIQRLITEIEHTRSKNDTSGFRITRKTGTRFVLFSELIYAEVIKHHLYFHLASGEVVTAYAPLKQYAEILLQDPRMVQNHRSFIINMEYINACEKRTVTMRDGTCISVPRDFENFQKKCFKWMFGNKEGPEIHET